MKRKILLPILLLVLAGCTRDILEEAPPDGGDGTRASLSSDYYYGYEGKKEYLTKVPEKFFVIYKKDKAGSLTRSGASLDGAGVSDYPLRASINKTAAEAAFADCTQAATTVFAEPERIAPSGYEP